MPTVHRARAARLLATVLVGSAVTTAGLTAGCGGGGKPAASAQQAPAPVAQPTRQLLPSNAPEGSQSAGRPPAAVGAAIPPAPAAQTTAVPPTPAPIPQQRQQPTRPPAAAQAVAPKPAAPAVPAAPTPAIPADAQWTISCFAVKGLDHVEGATKAKNALVQKTKRGDWYVVHGKDQSNIYFGFYRSIDPNDRRNAADVTRAHADLKTVQEVRDAQGNAPFARSAFVSLDTPDPTAVAEWSLFNVDKALHPKDPKRAFWSLQIMAFRGDQLRKEAAVQACRDLREQGIEAYYHHGDAVSSVTVGKWPAAAVKAQNRTEDAKDVAMTDPGTNLVVSNIPIPDNLEARPLDGRRSVSVAPKLEVLDPTLLAAMRKFPSHAVNYEIGVRKTDSGGQVEDPSFLVEIPRAKGNGPYDSADPDPVAAQPGNGWGRPTNPSMVGPSNPSYGANNPAPRGGQPRPNTP